MTYFEVRTRCLFNFPGRISQPHKLFHMANQGYFCVISFLLLSRLYSSSRDIYLKHYLITLIHSFPPNKRQTCSTLYLAFVVISIKTNTDF